jgi:hypothetical protein
MTEKQLIIAAHVEVIKHQRTIRDLDSARAQAQDNLSIIDK